MYAIKSQICSSVKIEPHMGMPVPIPPRRIFPCNRAGLAPSIRFGSVNTAGACMDIESAPAIVCMDASPAAFRSSAKTPSPAPVSPWQAAQFCAKSCFPSASDSGVVLDCHRKATTSQRWDSVREVVDNSVKAW